MTVPLYVFLVVQTDGILARARAKAAARNASLRDDGQFEHGTSLFLAQLADMLRREQELVARPTSEEIAGSAALHGRELRRVGATVAQVVHEYGDLGAAITELAMELGNPMSTDEFRSLNRCLDEAVAQAVTEYDRQRELSLSRRRAQRLGYFTHELRDVLARAIAAFEGLKGGTIGVGGSTGKALGRNLMRLRDLVDRLLAEVRLEARLRQRGRAPGTGSRKEVELAATRKPAPLA